jgi:hypothetical protein
MEPAGGTPKLNEALAKFQKNHYAAGKDGKANYGAYTTLGGGLGAAQPATEFGLSHSQTFSHLLAGEEVVTILVTTLRHESGEQITSELPFPPLQNRGNIMQALGSAITYARRYALLAIYGLAGEDDDADSLIETIRKPSKGISRTPTTTSTSNLKTDKKEEPKGINKIDAGRKARIVDALRVLEGQGKKQCLETFKKECKISATAITPEHIALPSHGDVLERLLKLPPYEPVT